MKECRTCGEVKPLTDFPYQRKHGWRGTGAGNYRLDCKECVAAAARAYRKTYTPQGGEAKRNRTVLESAIQARTQDAKIRAVKGGLAFDITPEYMHELFVASGGKCALSGLPMELDKGSLGVLSIDQIEAGLGYTRGNVQWLRWDVNRAKGEMGTLQFIDLCRSVVRCNDYPGREYTQAGGSAAHP